MQFLLELESVSSLAGHAQLFPPYRANPDLPLSISWVALNAVALLPFSTATHKRHTEEAIKPQLEPFYIAPRPTHTQNLVNLVLRHHDLPFTIEAQQGPL